MIGPDNDFAAVARFNGIGADEGLLSDEGGLSILDLRIGALEIASDEDFATTSRTAGVKCGFFINSDVVA